MTGNSVPLADTYRRLTDLCDDLHVRLSPGRTPSGTWLGMEDITAAPQALAAAIDGEAARIQAVHGRPARRDVVSSRLLHHYLWSVGLLFSGPWYLAGVVPALTPGQVWTDSATGDLALASEACIATSDPAAVRESVERFVRPLLSAFQSVLRRGPHALWGMTGDDLVSGIWYLGRKLGEEERAVQLAEELLPGGQFPRGANFRTLHDTNGRTHVTRTRTGCCLYYALQAGDACITCPRVTDDERLRRLEAAAG